MPHLLQRVGRVLLPRPQGLQQQRGAWLQLLPMMARLTRGAPTPLRVLVALAVAVFAWNTSLDAILDAVDAQKAER